MVDFESCVGVAHAPEVDGLFGGDECRSATDTRLSGFFEVGVQELTDPTCPVKYSVIISYHLNLTPSTL